MAMLFAVHPVLGAKDVAASIFFFQGLGFTCAWVDAELAPRYAVVRRDAVELHLQWADAGQFGYPVDRPAYRLRANDVDALFADFRQRGAALAEKTESPWAEPGDTPWGTREFHVRDPGGNVLQFYQLL